MVFVYIRIWLKSRENLWIRINNGLLIKSIKALKVFTYTVFHAANWYLTSKYEKP